MTPEYLFEFWTEEKLLYMFESREKRLERIAEINRRAQRQSRYDGDDERDVRKQAAQHGFWVPPVVRVRNTEN